jgi:hypothetical protein
MAGVHVVGAPTAITFSCCPVMQGRMPPLVGHRCRPGESLLHAGTHLICFFVVTPAFAC